MPRVAYMWSGLPHMPEVALRLRELIDWQPVLWVSYEYQEDQVRTLFPETPWQDLEDAFVGIPFPGVNSSQPPTLDEALLKRLQSYLPALMNQMNRFGPPDRFLYDERESFARNLFFQWHEVLVKVAPEIVFFEEAPNSPYTYAIYVLCLELDIPTVYLNATSIGGLSFLQEAIEAPPLRLVDALQRELERADSGPLLPSVEAAVASLRHGETFQHDYMSEQAEFDRAYYENRRDVLSRTAQHTVSRDLRWFIGRAFRAVRIWRWLPARRAARAEREAEIRRVEEHRQTPLRVVRRKFSGEPLGHHDWTTGEFEDYLEQARIIKEGLREDYRRRCVEPDIVNQPYIYFPLHYRPERTSNPDGGVFYDQIIPLAMISEALPEGWLLYVKEHPTQFSMMLEGECGRTTDYYDQIAALRGVQFVPTEYSSKALLTGCQACATITGTIGWEAALNGKPALYFGFPWYQGCPGTVRVDSASRVAEVLVELTSHLADERELQAYLRALGDATFPYTQTAWVMDPQPVTDEQQTAGLLEALGWWHQNRFLVRNLVSASPEPRAESVR